MLTIILSLHILVAFALVIIVLVQTGKGASMGAAFGGASQTLFGPRGATTFLHKLTTIAAILFMLTSLALAMNSTKREVKSIVEQKGEQEQTREETPPPLPGDTGREAPVQR